MGVFCRVFTGLVLAGMRSHRITRFFALLVPLSCSPLQKGVLFTVPAPCTRRLLRALPTARRMGSFFRLFPVIVNLVDAPVILCAGPRESTKAFFSCLTSPKDFVCGIWRESPRPAFGCSASESLCLPLRSHCLFSQLMEPTFAIRDD